MANSDRPSACWHLLNGLALLTMLSGCVSVDSGGPVVVSSQDKAGSLEITTAPGEPWASAAPALMPNFTMSGDLAVTKVLPTTAQITQQSLNAFEGSLALGLPQSSSGYTSTRTVNSTSPAASTDSDTTQQTTTKTRTSGTVPTAPGAPHSGSLPTAPATSGDLGVDPVVTYRAANYLNQMVQLFNRELQKAPQRRCYAPYLEMLKVAFVPYRTRLPYALHVRIGFFDHADAELPRPPLDMDAPTPLPRDKSVDAAREKAVAAAVDARKSAELAEKQAALTKNAADAITADMRAGAAGPPSISAATQAADRATADLSCEHRQVPMVIPIIATDDMQVALKSKAVEAAQQIGAALSLMVHGVGASAGASNLRESLNAILSKDLSSSLTVTRSSDNVLYLRIAPSNELSGQPVQSGQTYDIALLLLVPINYLHKTTDPAIGYDVVTQFRDVRTGAILPTPSDRSRTAALDAVLAPFLSQEARKRWSTVDEETKLYVAHKLSSSADGADVAFMVNALQCLPGIEPIDPSTYPNAFDRDHIQRGCVVAIESQKTPWVMTAMAQYTADSPFKAGLIDIIAPQNLGMAPQMVIVSDNGTSAASAVVGEVEGDDAARLQSYLLLKIKGLADPVRVVATGSVIDPSAKSLTLTFPTLSTFKLDGQSWADNGSKLIVKSVCREDREWCGAILPAPYVMEQPVRIVTQSGSVVGTSKLTISSSANLIVPNGQTANIAVDVAKLSATETAALTVNHSEIISATDSAGGPLQITSDGVTVPKNGHITLVLEDLSGEAITITAVAKVGSTQSGKHSITVPVKTIMKTADTKSTDTKGD